MGLKRDKSVTLRAGLRVGGEPALRDVLPQVLGLGVAPRALAMRASTAKRLAVGSAPAGAERGGAGWLGKLPVSALYELGMIVSAASGGLDYIVLDGV